jgi:MFS family permease
LAAAGLFAWLAEERPASTATSPRRTHEAIFATPALWLLFVTASLAFGLRDFAGSAMGSLGSLFLQKAHGFDVNQTGLILSAIFVASILSNPLFGGLSDRGRIRWSLVALTAAALVIFLFPRVPAGWLWLALAVYGFFFMASYPMIEAALMEAVHDSVRGRVFGFFITVGGLIGNLSHWLMGGWVRNAGPAAALPQSYLGIFALLAALVLCSLAGLACLHRIRRHEHARPTDAAAPVTAAAVRSPDTP